MIKEIIDLWGQNKSKLKDYFEITPMIEYDDYEKLVKKVFNICFKDLGKLDLENIIVLDSEGYQGDMVFIIKLLGEYDTNYLITHTYYGSCSGCDTLEGIIEYKNGLPNAEQVNEFMMLSLHLVQKLKSLFNIFDGD